MIRWGTTAVSLALAGPFLQNGELRFILASAALFLYTVLRTLRPLRYGTDVLAGSLPILAEVAVVVLTLTATGYWDSPFTFSLLTAVAIAGFARGFGFGIRIAVVSVLAVTIPWALEPSFSQRDGRTALQWAVEIVLVALVAGYARRISGEADERQSAALDQVGRLMDANALLYQLHQLTQTLPASLDLDEVLDAACAQLSDLFDYDALALLLFDETDGLWHTVRREGGRPPLTMTTGDLVDPLARCVRSRAVVTERNLLSSGGPGLAGSAGSGLYTVLSARGAVIGLIAIEHTEEHHFEPRDIELLAGLAEPAALAIDNARWFGRLRTVGADEERTRIARDLHDRIGQSLAYLAFELDRIVKSSGTRDEAVTHALHQLRGDVRGVIGEVRDTLYDLRTDVTETQSLPDTLESFLDRVRQRSGLRVGMRSQATGRLPILQEREMWRLAQEAVTNIERHAHATQISITWRCDGVTAALEVADDGIGFPEGTAGRLDSYGILGMRERAASIGATLSFDSQPGKGTRIRCALAAP